MTLALADVSVRLSGRVVVDRVSARLDGGLIGLIGPNGAGKSSLLRALAGLVPTDGVTLDGDAIATMPPARRARRIAYLPQGGEVHWPLTVERLVALGRLPHLAPRAPLSPADRDAIEDAMVRTATAPLRHRPVDTLSGGERARVLLARALAVAAPLLLVDEPLAALDPAHQLDMMALLRAEAERGVLVVAILHDLSLAARFCHRLLLMDHGCLIADGPPAEVLTPALLARAYGIVARIEDGLVAPLHRST